MAEVKNTSPAATQPSYARNGVGRVAWKETKAALKNLAAPATLGYALGKSMAKNVQNNSDGGKAVFVPLSFGIGFVAGAALGTAGTVMGVAQIAMLPLNALTFGTKEAKAGPIRVRNGDITDLVTPNKGKTVYQAFDFTRKVFHCGLDPKDQAHNYAQKNNISKN